MFHVLVKRVNSPRSLKFISSPVYHSLSTRNSTHQPKQMHCTQQTMATMQPSSMSLYDSSTSWRRFTRKELVSILSCGAGFCKRRAAFTESLTSKTPNAKRRTQYLGLFREGPELEPWVAGQHSPQVVTLRTDQGKALSRLPQMCLLRDLE